MTFVRFAFCPWRCTWCDSVYTWAASQSRMGGLPVLDSKQSHEAFQAAAEVETLSTSAIMDRVDQNPGSWVCITGGEPLSQPKAFRNLVCAIKDRSLSVEVETSGLTPLPDDDVFNAVDSWVVDVKTPSSGMQRFLRLGDLKRLRERDQVKFVVQSVEDLQFAAAIIEQHLKGHSASQILISPVVPQPSEISRIKPDEVAEFIKANLPNARLSIQIHKFVWGNQRGV